MRAAFTIMRHLAPAIIVAALLACAAPRHGTRLPVEDDTLSAPLPVPPVRFLVASDLHYFSHELGTSGAALEKYIRNDRKLLLMSGEILEAAIERMSSERADFILVCGDLTKDGERINHEQVARRLARLSAGGRRVYVIPGNHDIANGMAVRYRGDSSEPVDSVTADEFRALYRGMGYGDALATDTSSLSYVAEPVPGLWILALDSCLWRRNRPRANAVVAGAFGPQTTGWIERTLDQARARGKAVIAFMHHGILEHYPHNSRHFGMYLVADHQRISRLLARHGVRVVFTGHFHAQDITVAHFGDRAWIADIETGSLVTYPCPYRAVSVNGRQVMRIESRFITATKTMPAGFQRHAEECAFASTCELSNNYLARRCVRKMNRALLGPLIARAYITHIRGDERGPDLASTGEGLGPGGKLVLSFIKNTIVGLQTDIPPADNFTALDLVTGIEAAAR